MRNSEHLIPGMLVFGIVAMLAFAYMSRDSTEYFSRVGGDVRSGLGEEILVMRTPGGLLEVSTIRANEHFDKRIGYSLLGIEIGETVPHILVPAVYRYHIELAPEWPIHRSGSVFSVVAPPVRPSLPVAVDLTHIQKDVGGSWLLVVLKADEDLEALEREITVKLAGKAESPIYIRIQREYARQTVTEFVRKWLVTQARWSDVRDLTIQVRFADEMEGA